MAIIDAQVHAYERDHLGRPWHRPLVGPAQVTGDDMVAAMDAVGVDGALLVSPWTLYRYDPSYAVEVQAAHPGRFALVTPVDPRRDDVADGIARWAKTPGAVGIRLVLWQEGAANADHPGLDLVCAAAAEHGLPVCVLCWGQLPTVAALAGKHPRTQLVVDHLGLRQPFEPPPPSDPFAELPEVLALARHPNVAIKVTGACTLAHEPFPFADLRAPLGRVFEAFGFERCMWGTDWTRATALVTYADAVAAFREDGWLAPPERDALMGGTLSRIFGWTPSRA
jgi:L-fuconolactonase